MMIYNQDRTVAVDPECVAFCKRNNLQRKGHLTYLRWPLFVVYSKPSSRLPFLLL